MLQTNPEPVDRYWPTLGVGVGPGETIDYPVLLPGMVASEVDARPDAERTASQTADPAPKPARRARTVDGE